MVNALCGANSVLVVLIVSY
jgi:hypothetical protein